MRAYSYVGPPELIGIGVPATRIESATDLERWLEGSEDAQQGLTPATFIVDSERTLRLAPRGSEHVAWRPAR